MFDEKEVPVVEASAAAQENTANTEAKASAGTKLSLEDLELNIYDEKIEDIVIDILKEIDVFGPKSPFKGVHPVIISAPEGAFIRDGADLIKTAKDSGSPTIKARVLYTKAASQLALELGKIASGYVSDYGAALFSENVKNITRMIDRLLEQDHLFMMRKKGGAQPEGENADVVDYVGKRVARERPAIARLRVYGEYVNDHAFDMLIEKDMKKEFFERIRAAKTELIEGLKDKKTDDAEITRIVSDFVIKSLEEYSILSKLHDPGTTLHDYSRADGVTIEMAEKIATIATNLQIVAADLKALIEARKAA
jgi:hypothetical protein